ncbi:MAG TPA: hypothetical protein EYP14_09650 [Planctomycetaceae bacterium]|nr:hypothetical protein [Planctomycetaceae bacterium]
MAGLLLLDELRECIQPLLPAVPRKSKGGRFRISDLAYDAEENIRKPLRKSRLRALITRRDTEHGSGRGQVRWVVEEDGFAWIFQFRRLRVFYEKRDDIHEAFLAIGPVCVPRPGRCILICWNRVCEFC